MNISRAELIKQIQLKQSMLCVGLDVDLSKIPKMFKNSEDPIFEFNKAIIDATEPYTVAYKPNTAFYECYGSKGYESLTKTVNYIKQTYPHQFVIMDAKRGDIGNTANMYAQAFFETMPGDAITLSPYMGADSIKPFLKYENKWAIVLGITSNEGAQDFQKLPIPKFNAEGKIEVELLAEKVMQKIMQWGTPYNTMFVIGATQAVLMQMLRKEFPKVFFLVPGIGSQGGDLEQTLTHGIIPEDGGLLINSSRSILYASNDTDFATAAAREAKNMQQTMKKFL